MPGATLEALFPGLPNSGYRITSPIDPSCNCVGYVLLDIDWWCPNHPDGQWPAGVPRDDTLDGFVGLFQSQGFELCADDALEPGFEKIALYGSPSGAFGHVARQLPSGAWSSKLGELEDIEHPTLGALAGADYGDPLRFLKKQSAV